MTLSTSAAQSHAPNSDMSTFANLQRALVLPQEVIKQQAEIAAKIVRPRGALPWNRTSDFMLGTVAVAIILPQCVNGTTCRETWTQTEINEVRAEVQSGLDWWTQKAAISGANVQFQIIPNQPQVVNISNIEPIRVPGGNSAALCGDEGRWIDPVMMALGYNAYPPTDNQYLNEVRSYDSYLRDTFHSDWAIVVFVADASADAQNDPDDGQNGRGLFKFTTCGGVTFGVAAYGWITGPHMVMNNVNDGFQSILMDGIAAMEIGHIFGAPDEWNAYGFCMPPGQPKSCDGRWGYLNDVNGNCNYLNDPNAVTCAINDNRSIMRHPQDEGSPGIIVNSVNVYTKSHLGWRDSDGDQIPDPIDTDPQTGLQAYSPDPTPIRTPTYYGNAQDIAFRTDNGMYRDVTINTIRSVEYQIDNGPWIAATPVDGLFNSAYEEFRFVPVLCENRTYSIKARSTNSVGHRSPVVSDSLTVSSSSRCWNGYLPLLRRNASTDALPASPFQSPLPTPTP